MARSLSFRSRKHCASAPANAAATRSDHASSLRGGSDEAIPLGLAEYGRRLLRCARNDSRALLSPLLRLVGLARIRCGLAGFELERNAVHAVAQSGRLGPVLEDMPEMPTAAAAMHLGAAHEKAAVGLGLHRVVERRPEARPSRAAVELRAGVEQGLAAAGAVKDPSAVLLIERSRPGALGAVLAQDPVLLGIQLPAPFLVAELDLKMLVRFRLRAAAAQ